MSMNIVQAYTKFNNGLVILMAGFSGTGKTEYSRFLSELFGFKLVDLTEFYLELKEYDKEQNYETTKDGVKILKWDNIYESVNWDKFNTFVESNKKDGLVIYGFGFPTKLLKFVPDFHILVKISKQKLLENRAKFIENHTPDEKEIPKKIEEERLVLNTVTYPLYLKISEDSKFTKVINTNEMTEDQVKEELFGYLMAIINKWLTNRNSDGSQMSRPYYQRSNTSTINTSTINTNTINTSFTNSTNKNQNNYRTKPVLHNDGNSYAYDEYYYPNKKRVLYDFNDEGIDYPSEYRNKYNADKTSSSSSSDDDDDFEPEPLRSVHKSKKPKSKKSLKSSSSSDDDDATFLFTANTQD
jgi:hypothetical protein